MKILSKELLTAVLGEKRVILNYEVSICKTEIHYGHKKLDEDGFISIYELTHKCKEWANKKGYILSSAFHNGQGYCEIKKETPERIKSIAWCPVDFDTEAEAIFSACQYILDNESTIKE